MASTSGRHDTMGTPCLFFGRVLIGGEKMGRAYALFGFPLGFSLCGTATLRRPVLCDAMGPAGPLHK